jgi:hypothetical protein
MPEKMEVECPECEAKTIIYDPKGDGRCPKCELDVQKVHERARHERALKKVLEPKKEDKKADNWW